MDIRISKTIAAELREWQADDRRNAVDSLIRIAELLNGQGPDLDMPALYARRDGRALD